MDKPATDVDLGMPDLAGQLERDLDAPLPAGPLGQVLWQVVYGPGAPGDSAATFDSALPSAPASRPARRRSGPQEVAHAEGAAVS
ncbi:hypothetical protein [Streptomyces griseorubiginosus]|uniref:hypothetical protein n=1 Tax=Streptomyces griseorubiginosus TaxID=67304 RepID=UPI00114001C3|nr:hypothetical protein [Streptomyces griseorubiginosus]